jgi:hypothetical protein
MSSRLGSRLIKVAIGVVAVGLVAVGLIGFAHTKAGRPLLAYMPWAPPGCPMDLDNADPVKVEQFRREQMSKNQGTTDAKSQPALGFKLGETTKAEVERFVAAQGDRCEQKRQGTVYKCLNVDMNDGGPIVGDLHMQVDDQGRLVVVDAYRVGADAEATLAFYKQRGVDLDRDVGAATKERTRTDEELKENAIQRAFREYRYRSYSATLSVMNFGRRGLRVREQYQWLPEEPHAMR